jgi:hypothetical protein
LIIVPLEASLPLYFEVIAMNNTSMVAMRTFWGQTGTGNSGCSIMKQGALKGLKRMHNLIISFF